MASFISQLNSSNIPLAPERVYIGSYDTVTNYMTAIVTVNTSKDSTLTVFQSVDKIRSVSTVFQVLANTPFLQVILLKAPYFYLTLRNDSTTTAQTFLNLETIYRPSQVVADAGTSQNVNLFANISGVSTALDGVNVAMSNALDVYQSARPTAHAISFNGVATGIGKANILASFNVSASYFSKVSLFGNVSALEGGATPVNIFIAYSDDGSTWFTSSLGAINVATAGTDFSRDWETSAQYIGFYVDSLATLEVYYSLL